MTIKNTSAEDVRHSRAFINAELAINDLPTLVELVEEGVARARALGLLVESGQLSVESPESGVAAEDVQRLG